MGRKPNYSCLPFILKNFNSTLQNIKQETAGQTIKNTSYVSNLKTRKRPLCRCDVLINREVKTK